jgi:hypothetical protein
MKSHAADFARWPMPGVANSADGMHRRFHFASRSAHQATWDVDITTANVWNWRAP